jgi:multicomponent Na+:H+ antiporter subunit E
VDSSVDDVRRGPLGLLLRSPVRAASFFAFWVILSGLNPLDLAAGFFTAIAAAWASLVLLPPGRWSLRPLVLARLVLRFLRQSIVAGLDVAWRALDPRMPLRPGFVVYPSRLPPGPARNAFCTLTSLLPGTLPSGTDASGNLFIHCLDVTQPVAEQLKEEEALFVHMLGGDRDNA